MNGVLIGSTSLSFIRHLSNYEIDCGDVDGDGEIIFGFGCGQPSITSFNGQSFNVIDHASVITKHSNVTHKRFGGSCEVVLKCSAELLEKRLQAFLGRSLANDLVFERNVAMDEGIGAHARSTLFYVMNSLDQNPALLDNPLIAASYENLLLGTILSLPSNYSEALLDPGKKSSVPAAVSRAEEYMASNADSPISIADVLSHTGCSRKSLFENFRKYRGYTPGEFLANERLMQAHERLSEPSESDSVTSIAYESGFSHLGRFSEVYRKRYGVRPSETLKRALLRFY
jgi:AraC-like DNA-binding protein